ncbi:MAG: ribonuclease III [Clostridiales bacterium]|jgi:ribonuclease-3|nr:ribonuclease III [Clostridiales bacterium]
MEHITDDRLSEIEKILGYSFRRKALLRLALTHSSTNPSDNNERLEFVGDGFLAFVTADYLMRNFEEDEGVLTEKRKSLVRKETLAKIAQEHGIDKFLSASKNLNYSEKVTSSLFEALIAAVYYDAGFEKAYAFVLRFLKKYLSREEKDYKSLLQELAVKICKDYPIYTITEKNDDGKKIFTCSVSLCGETRGAGIGSTKKEAQQNAAKEAYTFAQTKKSGEEG